LSKWRCSFRYRFGRYEENRPRRKRQNLHCFFRISWKSIGLSPMSYYQHNIRSHRVNFCPIKAEIILDKNLNWIWLHWFIWNQRFSQGVSWRSVSPTLHKKSPNRNRIDNKSKLSDEILQQRRNAPWLLASPLMQRYLSDTDRFSTELLL